MNTKSISMSFFFFFVLHAILDLFYGAILETLWIDKIKAFSEKSFISGPEISFWKFLVSVLDRNELIKIISLFAMVIIYIVLFQSIRTNSSQIFIIISFIPVFSSYTHMYDLIPLIVFICITTTLSLNFRFTALAALIVPPQIEFSNLVAILTICFLVCGAFLISRINFNRLTLLYSLTYCNVMLLLSYFYSANDAVLELSTRLALVIPLIFLEFNKFLNLGNGKISNK